MKARSRSILILGILFGYILLQFLWWEVLLVKQTGQIIDLKQKISELSITNESTLINEIALLHKKKTMQVMMIVGEGTVFLLLLLFGIYKIKQSQDKETELNNQQKNFFLSITHELKTPLASSRLMLQTIRKHDLPEEKRKELLEKALEENHRLESLIDNILNATRLEHNALQPVIERIDLSEAIKEITSRFQKRHLNAQFNLRITESVVANADVFFMDCILSNLLENAVKYAGSHSVITIELTQVKAEVFLAVSDNGPGIPDEEKRAIFRKFYRSGNEEIRAQKGSGLGLYIVSELVRLQQGTIQLSRSENGGAKFQITLPL